MSRLRKKETISVGGKFETALAVAFLNLCRNNGVSMREALRRVMTQAILDGKVPGINHLDLELHEREKWGQEAVPTSDGEDPQTVSSSRSAAKPRVE